MVSDSCVRSASSARCWSIWAAAWVFAIWMPSVFAQDEKGCEGVGFAKPPFSHYSPENLQKRLGRNPEDVNALIHLGTHLPRLI